MKQETLKETIRQELPELLRHDPEFRSRILEITRETYADRKETQNWFYEILDEMRRERERQDKKWEKYNKEQEDRQAKEDAKWDNHIKEEAKKWDEHIEEEAKKQDLWQEQWKAHELRHKEEFNRVHEEIMAMVKKYDRSIGALGARWGMQSERSFRNALAGILEENFDVEVLNVNEFDDQGVVFGRPDQIELDIIIKNGLLLICELKSSIDKAGMYIFERKARFYESLHNRKADQLIVISPMIDPRAKKVAKYLNIKTYSDSLEVESLDEG